MSRTLANVKGLIGIVVPYVSFLAAFFMFVLWNGSVVLGKLWCAYSFMFQDEWFNIHPI